MTVFDEAQAWLADDPDPQTRDELATLVDAARRSGADAERALAELEDRFAAPLEFGTAGLRGTLGAGPNRMNRVVVIRAAAGLASYLNARGGGRVVIGFDSRLLSDVFAAESAAVLVAAGLQAMVLPRPLPTPVLAYAIRHLDCAAGVMVTASHNPAPDNGYKVYLGDGSQIVPPIDAEIAEAMAQVGPLATIPRGENWQLLDESIVDHYLDRVSSLVEDGPRDLRAVYTPLHGVGGDVVHTVLELTGFSLPREVETQAAPDPAFPTTPFPNPEEPGTMDLAIALGEIVEADVVVANDPDADRCAIAIPTDDGFRMVSGDELGALVATHLLRKGHTGTLATTIVSSSLLSAIAEHHGMPFVQTLTGFKWLGRVPNLAFSYEEALGYCVDPQAVADKDGIATLLLVFELTATLKAAGRTLQDELDDLARTYGLYLTEQLSARFRSHSEIDAVLERLRAHPPSRLGNRRVQRIDDLTQPTDDLLPTTGVRYVLGDDARVVIRPSGTEPKLKCYLELIVPVTEAAGTGPGNDRDTDSGGTDNGTTNNGGDGGDVRAAQHSGNQVLAGIRADLAQLVDWDTTRAASDSGA